MPATISFTLHFSIPLASAGGQVKIGAATTGTIGL